MDQVHCKYSLNGVCHLKDSGMSFAPNSKYLMACSGGCAEDRGLICFDAEPTKRILVAVQHTQVFEVDIPCSVENEQGWVDSCLCIEDVATNRTHDWMTAHVITKAEEAFE